jgi:hypothetical protein
MKFLGWILFLAINSQAFAQGVVIEPAPLSVEDNGTRKIIDRKEGETPATENPKDVVAPPPAEALVIPNDDVINPPEGSKKETPKKTVKAAKPAPKVEAKPVAIEVIPAITPIAEKPAAPVNPIDGQLKLDGPTTPKKKLVEVEIQNTVTAPDQAPTSIDIIAIGYVENPLKKYLQFSFGYMNSRYEKIHSSLDNGSTMTSFKFVADMTQKWQSGFAVEILADTSGQTTPDNIRVVQYRLFVDHHAPLFYRGAMRLDWVGGLSFSIGDFGIRRRYLNGLGQEVSVKLKDGIIVGLIPAAGLRIYLIGQNSLDLMVEYHQYFGNPQKYIGGLAISPRLSFVF